MKSYRLWARAAWAKGILRAIPGTTASRGSDFRPIAAEQPLDPAAGKFREHLRAYRNGEYHDQGTVKTFVNHWRPSRRRKRHVTREVIDRPEIFDVSNLSSLILFPRDLLPIREQRKGLKRQGATDSSWHGMPSFAALHRSRSRIDPLDHDWGQILPAGRDNILS
jgi:hypothetical protein